jgi:cold shock CspA family protein
MVKIAVFKWFSRSHNNPDTSKKQFECEDGSKFLICHSEVKCSESELKRGVFIQFEINNKNAKNLQLLRKVGKVDWFKKDKGFGISKLIFTHDLEDLDISNVFVHKSEFTPTVDDLEENDLITFNIKNFLKHDNQIRHDAINLNLLNKETSLDIIQECWDSTNSNLWFPVFHNYILSLESHEDIVREITIKVSQFTSNHPNRGRFSRLIELLPKEIHAREGVRQFLKESKQIEILLSLIDINNPQTLLTDELKLRLQSISPLLDLWEQIPESLILESKIWAIAPLNRFDTFLKSLEPDKYESSICKIVEILESSELYDRSVFLTKLPESIKRHHSIFDFLTVIEQVNILISQIKVNLSSQNQSLENLLDDLSQHIEKDKEFEWKKIPNEILIQEKIWNLTPVNIKFQAVLSQIANSNSTVIIDKLLNLLSQTLDEEKQLLIDQIPVQLKQHHKIFPMLSSEQQLKILKNRADNIVDEQENIIKITQSKLSSCGSINEKRSLISRFPNWVKETPSIQKLIFQSLEVHLRPDVIESKQIRAFVAEREINCLCHFTTIENFHSICRSGSILSVRQLKDKNSQYDQMDEGRWDGNLNHICCSIQSWNSWYLSTIKHRSQLWILLIIKPDYLWKQETLFFPINAASGRGAYKKIGLEGLQSMYNNEIIDIRGRIHTRAGKPNSQPTCIQAEVQIYESINLNDVIIVRVNEDLYNEKMIRDAGWQVSIGTLRGF